MIESKNLEDRSPRLIGGSGPDPASDNATVYRRAAIFALNAVYYFLAVQGIVSVALFRLEQRLKAVEHGDTPAIFTPARRAGRKADSSRVQYEKGWFAGMAYVQMQYGLSREQAAQWVARNIPARLARRLSRKPISPSTVKQWMDQYGCNLRIRRRIISEGLTDDFSLFLRQEIQSRHRDLSHGEHGCLRMMDLGHVCWVAGQPVPFQEIFDDLQEQFNRRERFETQHREP